MPQTQQAPQLFPKPSAPIIPVIVIEQLSDALPLAQALIAGGLNVLEITLRSPAALEAITLIRRNCPQALVGAGTVLNAAQAKAVQDAGAQFAVSPGATPSLMQACRALDLPLLPGAVNASQIMDCLDHGYRFLKFFPASTSGGAEALKAFAGPFADVQFCPTGGVKLDTLSAYLSCPNVVCVGGSWMLPAALIQAQDWPQITELSAEAVASAKRAGWRG